MNKLLAIVGPTGTGKTARAIEEAEKTPSILVSADSRQVYRGMDIVTGKDHPQEVTLFGVDIVDPDEPCSVAVWFEHVMPEINKAWNDGKQVIVVGGTGLYVKALTDGIATMSVPINESLRDELNLLSTFELQSKLLKLSKSKYESMNNSDQHNPRRLIRAIEITLSPPEPSSTIHPLSTKLIGLRYYDDSNYSSKIRQRVISRIKQGAIEETESLLKNYGPDIQSMSAIGYKSIISYLDKKTTESEMIESWVGDELSYAKRQLTWFRKQSVIWYDIDIV